MWVYGCGLEGSTGPKLVLFDYLDGRSGANAVKFLEGYRGYLQVEGYASYEQTFATLAGCWARMHGASLLKRNRHKAKAKPVKPTGR